MALGTRDTVNRATLRAGRAMVKRPGPSSCPRPWIVPLVERFRLDYARGPVGENGNCPKVCGVAADADRGRLVSQVGQPLDRMPPWHDLRPAAARRGGQAGWHKAETLPGVGAAR